MRRARWCFRSYVLQLPRDFAIGARVIEQMSGSLPRRTTAIGLLSNRYPGPYRAERILLRPRLREVLQVVRDGRALSASERNGETTWNFIRLAISLRYATTSISRVQPKGAMSHNRR